MVHFDHAQFVQARRFQIDLLRDHAERPDLVLDAVLDRLIERNLAVGELACCWIIRQIMRVGCLDAHSYEAACTAVAFIAGLPLSELDPQRLREAILEFNEDQGLAHDGERRLIAQPHMSPQLLLHLDMDFGLLRSGGMNEEAIRFGQDLVFIVFRAIRKSQNAAC